MTPSFRRTAEQPVQKGRREKRARAFARRVSSLPEKRTFRWSEMGQTVPVSQCCNRLQRNSRGFRTSFKPLCLPWCNRLQRRFPESGECSNFATERSKEQFSASPPPIPAASHRSNRTSDGRRRKRARGCIRGPRHRLGNEARAPSEGDLVRGWANAFPRNADLTRSHPATHVRARGASEELPLRRSHEPGNDALVDKSGVHRNNPLARSRLK